MPEIINKLQPDRTIHLRGFDHLGASASIHSATPTGFTVSGNFRDAADFAVLVLHDADNFFEHPRVKHLPDFNFDGLTLSFDLACEGLMPINSRKYATIDWPYLDVITASNQSVRVPLSACSAVIGTPDTPATAQVSIVGPGLEAWDRVTLWYQNSAFDYIVPGKVRTEYAFYAGTPGTIHQIIIRDRLYAYIEQPGDTSALVASKLIDQISGFAPPIPADPELSASAAEDPWIVKLERKLDTGASVQVSASGYLTETLWHVKDTTVCREFAAQINGASYSGAPFSLSATVDGTTLHLRTVEGGYDANFIRMYATSKNERLTTSSSVIGFAGGSSTAKFRVTLDFAALGIPQIRRMWLTLAPRLSFESDYGGETWKAVFSNWTVTGPDYTRRLRFATPAGVRVPAVDPRCTYSGPWNLETGFYTNNMARVAMAPGSSVAIQYNCPHPHDLWIGTSLYTDRGTFRVEIDGVERAVFDTALANDTAVVTRRRAVPSVAPGTHTVLLTSLDSRPVYFDYLDAVVEGDLPEPLPAQTFHTPALDYSTDHTYKLPAARILWQLNQLGAKGPIDQYVGVFWWNERLRRSGSLPEVTVHFSGGFAAGDQVFIDIGGQVCGKSVFPNEDASLIANHFACLINATYVGVWARVDESSLVIRARSAAPAYNYTVTPSIINAQGSTGAVSGGGSLSGGQMGVWEIDPDAAFALNPGARAWHQDLYARCALEGRHITTAISMELVNPPAAFAARYPDGAPVITDVGFGGLRSTHCAFRSEVLAYQKKVLSELASMQADAGLTPDLQFGEFTWWYFTSRTTQNPLGGMAYYDSETAAAAQSSLGRPLFIFTGPDDDPNVNAGADALFLRNRLRDYAASLAAHIRHLFANAQLEILFPLDVNFPTPAGLHSLGGRLNHSVNLPPEWLSKASSGFNRFRIEALDFGAWSRNLELARKCIKFLAECDWPRESLRAMVPVFRGGYPWFKEVRYAKRLGFDSVNLWALDHVCLYGLSLAEPPARWASFSG